MAAPATPGAPADPNTDPFASIGGGVYINGGWVPRGYPGSGTQAGSSGTGGSAPAPASITTAQGVSATPATVGSTTAAGSPTTVAASFQQGLVNRLNPQPVTMTDPSVAPAIAANNLQTQRAMENAQAQLAEQSAQNGTSMSGGFQSQLAGLNQAAGASEGQFAGNAILQRRQAQDLASNLGLQLAGGLLTGQQALGQQADLANLEAQIQQQALTNQNQLGQGQLNLGLLSALLQNQQFGQSLGQQGAEFGQSLDQAGVLGLLGLM